MNMQMKYLTESLNNRLIVYVILLSLDIFLGVLSGFKTGKTKKGILSSDTFKKGVIIKIGNLMLWLVVFITSNLFKVMEVYQFSSISLIIAEIFSLIENLNNLGVKVPESFLTFIRGFKHNDND